MPSFGRTDVHKHLPDNINPRFLRLKAVSLDGRVQQSPFPFLRDSKIIQVFFKELSRLFQSKDSVQDKNVAFVSKLQ